MNAPEFGAPPPAPSGWSRMAPFVNLAVAGSAAIAVSMYVLQIVMPEGWRPSEIMGDAAGSFEEHDLKRKMPARLDYDRRSADATSQAQAKTQTDVAIVTAAMNQQAQNLNGLGVAAVASDLACIAGNVVAAMTQPSLGADWRRPNTGGDLHSGAQTVARATCGLGDGLRQETQRSLFAAGQAAAAARGMSLTDGSVREAAAPAVPHREWTREQREQLVAYANRQPDAARSEFGRGIDVVRVGLTPEWYDRVAAHRYDHPER